MRALLAAMTGDADAVPDDCRGADLGGAFQRDSGVARDVIGVLELHHAGGRLALVLGANLGSAINPLVEGSHSDNPASRRLPLGNLLNRADRMRARVALPASGREFHAWARAQPVRTWLPIFIPLFNLALAVVFILPLHGLAKLLTWLPADRPKPNDPSTPLYLDESAIGDPVGGARLCGARDPAHRRHRRNHAAPGTRSPS